MFCIKHTFGFKHVRYQLIVDFHEFFVYFLIIFGVFISEKYEISTLDPNYNYKLSPFNHAGSLGPGPHGAPVVAPPVPEARGVGVGVDVAASVQLLAH